MQSNVYQLCSVATGEKSNNGQQSQMGKNWASENGELLETEN